MIGFVFGIIATLAWLWLLLFRGGYWRFKQELTPLDEAQPEGEWPSVCVLVPARNESNVLRESLPTLLNQDYPGELRFYLVDDSSTDDTKNVAFNVTRNQKIEGRFHVIDNTPTPSGWTGKVWALHTGLQKIVESNCDLILLTDADIKHEDNSVKRLVYHLECNDLDLASLMANLRAESFWEEVLIPSFVYYFSLLFPFEWVNNPEKDTAAAAGGCVLVKKSKLVNAGGFEEVSDAIIDDCALAKLIKSSKEGNKGKIWLGLSNLVSSVRSYGGLKGIWKMVSRSAFTQLRNSFLLLMGTVIGLIILFVAPPGLLITGIIGLISSGFPLNDLNGFLYTGIGALSWILMGISFLPIMNWYNLPKIYATLGPLSGTLYTLMTIDSALKWVRGRGGNWKGRTYN